MNVCVPLHDCLTIEILYYVVTIKHPHDYDYVDIYCNKTVQKRTLNVIVANLIGSIRCIIFIKNIHYFESKNIFLILNFTF